MPWFLLVVSVLLLGWTQAQQAFIPYTEREWNSTVENSTLEETVEEYKNIVDSLTRQLIMQQLYMEEKTRSDGDSGVKQVRVNHIGTRSFHSQSHVLNSMLSIHDHSNYINTVGLGEFVAVLNGIEFRTRHNDYKLRMPSTTSGEWGATQDIEFPDVPPQVLAKPNIDAQIREMRLWFKAFKNRWNPDKGRDYRRYFKPVLCYLEGMWTLSAGEVDEPFESDRHSIDAANWFDLTEKVRFTGYSGRKSAQENFSYLPMKIMEIVNGSVPRFAQWNYRIACAPLKEWVSPKKLKVVDDLNSRMAYRRTLEKHQETRAARFTLEAKPYGTGDKFYTDGYLDQLMEQIPGRDNYGAELLDKAFNQTAAPIDAKFGENKALNVGYYHRFYKLMARDAMGLKNMNRGFSDRNIFMAMTTNPKVAPMKVTDCKGKGKKKVCTDYEQRWTYAIPLEVIYLTPLSKWNPLDIPYRGDFRSKEGREVTKGGRNGGFEKHTAWNGTNSKVYYLTPDAFFSGGEVGKDPADTAKGAAGVLDRKGNVTAVRATGIRVFLPNIPDVGIIRQRYPIAPAFIEGSAIYKELEALKMIVMQQQTFAYMMKEKPGNMSDGGGSADRVYELSLSLTRYPEEHSHTVEVTSDQLLDSLRRGTKIKVESSQDLGHTHSITFHFSDGKWLMTDCDGQDKCWDGHSSELTIT